MNKGTENENKAVEGYLSLITILGGFLLIAGTSYQYTLLTSTDELGTIVGAASLAGLDWNETIKNSSYYGFGWYALFWWVFRVTDSPTVIYTAVTLFTAILRAMIIPMTYYILHKYVQCRRIVSLSAAFLSPFLITTQTGGIMNEHPLYFCGWLIILCICKVLEKKEKNRYQIALVFLTACAASYALTIHTRGKVLFFAAGICTITSLFLIKKWSCLLFTLAIFPVNYFLVERLIKIYQLRIWGVADGLGGAAANVSVTLNQNSPIVWGTMLGGLISSKAIMSCGVFVIAIVTIVVFVFRIRWKENEQYLDRNQYVLSIILFSVVASCGVIFAFLNSDWYRGILGNWNQNNEWTYSYKALTYLRYWENFAAPLMVIGGVLLLENDSKSKKKIIRISIIICCIMLIYFWKWIIPLIEMKKVELDCLYPFIGITRYHYGDRISTDWYTRLILIALSAIILEGFLLLFDYRKLAYIVLAAYLIAPHISIHIYYDNPGKERCANMILASYMMKENLEEKGVYLENVYLYDDSPSRGYDKNWQIFSIAQFYFNRYTLHMTIPESIGERDIIICASDQEGVLERKYSELNCYVLDDNEKWYTKLVLDGE